MRAEALTDRLPMKVSNSAPHAIQDCSTLRLAHGDVATVDMCSCGTLRLNLGAITVRMTPQALSSLVQTVSESLATHSALRSRPRFSTELGEIAAPAKLARGGQS
jgi:hypothetical protein